MLTTMLQYLIILFDDTSASFCHYDNHKQKRRLISLDTLKKAIYWSMKENLMIQYVYPDYDLPSEYISVIESIDHSKIKPCKEDADIWVTESITGITSDVPIVWRCKKEELFSSEEAICDVLRNTPRLNIILTGIEYFSDEDFEKYKSLLAGLGQTMEKLYVNGKSPQLNLLTDRMMLSEMNNCGAGNSSITLAPNGKFYVCPAFYDEDETDSIGDLENGLDIKNRQLYRLDHAPICRHCDAWQCKRCIWLNCKTTLEVNTPSHEQCVLAHLERNASRVLLNSLRSQGTFLPDQEEIKEIDYLDPFDKRDEWI